MRTLFILVAVATVAGQTSIAQSQVKPGPFGTGLPQQGTARLFVTPPTNEAPHSLKELCEMSTLIVEGVIKTSLFPRQLSPGTLETDAVISVTNTLKGGAPNPDIAISQLGGTIGQVTIKPVQYSIVQPGQQYLLFLKDDTRPQVPQIAGVKRYRVTGAWAGLFYFNAGKMQVNEPDEFRKSYEGLSIEQVISKVKDAIIGQNAPPSWPFDNVVTKP